MGETIFIGIGSNLGDSRLHCREAVKRLSARPGITDVKASPFYQTPPFGVTDQPDFVNGAVRAFTTLSARELLTQLLSLESEMGRERKEKWGPRLIDLDLLFYGKEIIEEPGLVVPHPGVVDRPFVLVPLCDLEPGWVHPASGQTLRELCDALDDTSQIKRLD